MTEIFAPFLTIELLYAVFIAFAGGLVRGYSGFGSGMVMTPLMALMWGPLTAIITVVGSGVIGSAQLAITSIKNINRRDATPILISALIFSPLGAVMLINFDPEIIKRIIGVAILTIAVIQMLGWQYKGPRGVIPASIAGAISAWVNGVSSVGGPVAVMYYVSLPEEPRVQRANIAVTIYTHGLLLFLTLVISGQIGLDNVVWCALVLPPYFLGMRTGTRLFNVLPDRIFRWVILWMLVVLSVVILVA